MPDCNVIAEISFSSADFRFACKAAPDKKVPVVRGERVPRDNILADYVIRVELRFLTEGAATIDALRILENLRLVDWLPRYWLSCGHFARCPSSFVRC
jgi:hypothetical protein